MAVPSKQDERYMRAALALARRGIGLVAPNPSVGCVIVKDGQIVGRGRTQNGGRPHAETVALDMAGDKARDADVYVTLEPCAHEGKTPPCAKALVNAGVARVVLACIDPDPRVSGLGLMMLKKAKIEVVEHCLADEARAINIGFFSRIQRRRPVVTLKTATTLDGKIALSNGESRWITSELSRRHVHLTRSHHDAVLSGIGTVLNDNPRLYPRIKAFNYKGLRIVLDKKLQTPLESALVAEANRHPLWIFTKSNDVDLIKSFEAKGVRIFQHDPYDLNGVLAVLAKEGINSVLIEAGGKLQTSFLKGDLVDQIYWYRAPSIIGGDGISSVSDMGFSDVAEIYKFKSLSIQRFGSDTLEILEKE